MGAGPIPGADSHWRGIVDLVIDYNPTSALSFALNGDFDNESDFGGGTPVGDLVRRQPRHQVRRGRSVRHRAPRRVLHDNHGGIVPNEATPGTRSDVESGTLTLSYVAASKLTLMLDNRVDFANSESSGSRARRDRPVSKTMFTTTLGAIIATK